MLPHTPLQMGTFHVLIKRHRCVCVSAVSLQIFWLLHSRRNKHFKRKIKDLEYGNTNICTVCYKEWSTATNNWCVCWVCETCQPPSMRVEACAWPWTSEYRASMAGLTGRMIKSQFPSYYIYHQQPQLPGINPKKMTRCSCDWQNSCSIM